MLKTALLTSGSCGRLGVTYLGQRTCISNYFVTFSSCCVLWVGQRLSYNFLSRILPSYSGLVGRGDGVVLGKVWEMPFPWSLYSEWSGLVWSKCSWLQDTSFPNKTTQDRLFVSESRYCPGRAVPLKGAGPGEGVTGFGILFCTKNHTRSSLKVPHPRSLWDSFSRWRSWENPVLHRL